MLTSNFKLGAKSKETTKEKTKKKKNAYSSERTARAKKGTRAHSGKAGNLNKKKAVVSESKSFPSHGTQSTVATVN